MECWFNKWVLYLYCAQGCTHLVLVRNTERKTKFSLFTKNLHKLLLVPGILFSDAVLHQLVLPSHWSVSLPQRYSIHLDFWVLPSCFNRKCMSLTEWDTPIWNKLQNGNLFSWKLNIYHFYHIFLPQYLFSEPSPRPTVQDAGNRCVKTDLCGWGSPAPVY